MSEFFLSSAEYSVEQYRLNMAPHACRITSLRWCAGKNLMVYFTWGDRTRRVNIAAECRQKFGKLTEKVRIAIRRAMPEYVTISTRISQFEDKKRYLHSINPEELATWLDKVEI